MTKRYEICAALWHVPTIVGRTEFDFNVHNVVAAKTQEQRCDLLRDAVSNAATHFGDPTPGIQRLNVFVIPEYFFAQSAASHFVDQYTKDAIVENLKSISRIGKTLLIGGTIAWIKPFKREPGFINKMRSSRYKRAKKRIRGAKKTFEPETNQESRSVRRLKDAKRDGDLKSFYFAENTAYIMHDGKQILKYHKRMDGMEINAKDEEGGRNLIWVPGPRNGDFKVNGVNCGIEICAEHLGGTLKQTAGAVDLQILISATMNVMPESKANIREGGYILHCDAIQLPSVHKLENGAYRNVEATKSQLKTTLSQDEIADRLITTREDFAGKGEDEAKLQERFEYALTKLSGRLNYYTLPLAI